MMVMYKTFSILRAKTFLVLEKVKWKDLSLTSWSWPSRRSCRIPLWPTGWSHPPRDWHRRRKRNPLCLRGKLSGWRWRRWSCVKEIHGWENCFRSPWIKRFYFFPIQTASLHKEFQLSQRTRELQIIPISNFISDPHYQSGQIFFRIVNKSAIVLAKGKDGIARMKMVTLKIVGLFRDPWVKIVKMSVKKYDTKP